MNKGKLSQAFLAARENKEEFNWKNLHSKFLDDVLMGVIFNIYKNNNISLACKSFLLREDNYSKLLERLDFLIKNLTFPLGVSNEIIKQNTYLLIVIDDTQKVTSRTKKF